MEEGTLYRTQGTSLPDGNAAYCVVRETAQLHQVPVVTVHSQLRRRRSRWSLFHCFPACLLDLYEKLLVLTQLVAYIGRHRRLATGPHLAAPTHMEDSMLMGEFRQGQAVFGGQRCEKTLVLSIEH